MLTQGTEGAILQLPDYLRKELVHMVTYSDLFAFMSMICSIVTLVVTLNERKKQRPCPGKIRRYF